MARRRTKSYDAERFRKFVEPLLDQRSESYRRASMAAGLDETAISRYFSGTQPMRDACIALADHFDINPNELLKVAGYEPLRFFDRRLVDPDALPPDVEQFVGEIMQLEDEAVRREMVDTLRQVLRVQMRMRDATIRRVVEQAGE